jgi:hypothetical protein
LRFEALLVLLQSSLARSPRTIDRTKFPISLGSLPATAAKSWRWITGSGEETQEGELDG